MISLAIFLYLAVFHQWEQPQEPLDFLVEKVSASDEKPCDGLIPVRTDIYFKGDPAVMIKAYRQSGCNREFVKLLDCENDQWDMHRKSDIVGEDSWGLCQIHRRWHADVVDDPRFFTDLDFQIEQCIEKFTTGTPFSCAPNGRVIDKGRIYFIPYNTSQ